MMMRMTGSRSALTVPVTMPLLCYGPHQTGVHKGNRRVTSIFARRDYEIPVAWTRRSHRHPFPMRQSQYRSQLSFLCSLLQLAGECFARISHCLVEPTLLSGSGVDVISLLASL